MKLWTQTSGAGDDLFLIHGWGMNASVWLPLARALEKGCRVTLVELPGHGESPWEDSAGGLQGWAEQLLEAAPADAVWAGWSLGGLVMQQAAWMRPQKLRALVGIATSPCFVRRDDWPCGIPPLVLESFAAELEADTGKTLRRFLALQLQGAENARELLPQLRKAFDARPAPRLAGLRAGLEILLHSDLRKQLGALDLPLYWMLGERDTLAPAKLGAVLPEYQPRMQLQVIDGAAHAPFLSHLPQCLELLKGVLRHA
ncbi:pimeloyl-ACP methyl ester esterase BioH [Thiolapillus sp.]